MLALFDQAKFELLEYFSKNAQLLVPISIALLLISVAGVIKANLRDNNIGLLRWGRALGFSVLFVLGMPLVALVSSGFVIWLITLIAPYIDPLSVLARFSPLDYAVAADSRPWAYVATLLAVAYFVYRKIRRFGRLNWKRIAEVVVFVIFCHCLFQIGIYALLKLFR